MTKFLVLAFIFIPVLANAQNWGPAFDSNVYFPKLENPSEMDSIYGSRHEQKLGEGLFNGGLRANADYGSVFLSGLRQTSEMYTQIYSAPGLKLKSSVKRPTNLPYNVEVHYAKKAHFRSTLHTDLFVDRQNWFEIYWADDNGNYDSNRRTILKSSLVSERTNALGSVAALEPVIADFNGDSLDDIVCGAEANNIGEERDSLFIVFFQGGDRMYVIGDTLTYDSILYLTLITTDTYESRTVTIGDFRGTGRKDVIAADDYGNLFYYKNDPPFSLAEFSRATLRDTLFSTADNPAFKLIQGIGNWGAWQLAAPMLSKAATDRSDDFLPSVFTHDNRDMGIFIFRGGSEFASQRLLLDDAEYVIRHPKNLDQNFTGIFNSMNWPYDITNCGDVTGTGNPVLFTGGSTLTSSGFFYVLGKAVDDKIDMAVFGQQLEGYYNCDTITANADSRQDVILTRPLFESKEDRAEGVNDVGTARIIYGSSKIPVTLNPKYATVRVGGSHSIASLVVGSSNGIRLQVYWPDEEVVTVVVRDILGRIVLERRLEVANTHAVYSIDSLLPTGAYFLFISGSANTAFSKFTVL